MKRQLTPQQQKARSVYSSVYWKTVILLCGCFLALVFLASAYFHPPRDVLLANIPMMLSMPLANIYAPYKAGQSVHSQKVTYRHFLPRITADTDLPTQQFAFPFLKGFLVNCCWTLLCCWLCYYIWPNADPPDFSAPIGKYFILISCFIGIVGLWMNFPKTITLRFTAVGVEAQNCYRTWTHIYWEAVAGCEIEQKRNYLGYITSQTLFFKDKDGHLLLETPLQNAFPPEEQKRVLVTLASFLQPQNQSGVAQALTPELEELIAPPK